MGVAQRVDVLVQLGLPTLLAVGRWGFTRDATATTGRELVAA